MTIKGGSTIDSDNNEFIEPVNNILLDLGFESDELEMIENMSQNEINYSSLDCYSDVIFRK